MTLRVQLDTGIPVVFGDLASLTENRALVRARIGKDEYKGHSHGDDWGLATGERWNERNYDVSPLEREGNKREEDMFTSIVTSLFIDPIHNLSYARREHFK